MLSGSLNPAQAFKL